MEEREYWQWRCGEDSAWNFRTKEEAATDHERQRVYSSHAYTNCVFRATPLVVEQMPLGE